MSEELCGGHCGACDETHGDWEKRIVCVEAERDDFKRKLALILDQSCLSDSLGVPGSDFTVCRWCGGGSSPGKDDFKHNAPCLMDNDELERQVAEVWESESA